MRNNESWEGYFPGADSISESLAQKTMQLIHQTYEETPAPASSDSHKLCPRMFYPDGRVESPAPMTVYPWQAPYILGNQIPWEFPHVEPWYSRAASKTGFQWLHATQDICNPFDYNTLGDGILIQREGYQFAVPFLADFQGNHIIPVMCLADSPANNEYWEANAIPTFVLSQVRLQMALLREAVSQLWPNYTVRNMIIVRIAGNLEADTKMRIYLSNPTREDSVLHQVEKRLSDMIAQGEYNLSGNVTSKRDWQVEQANMIAGANFLDTELYDTIAAYMALQSERKALEAETQAMKAREDTIALQMADLIGNAGKGQVKDCENGRIYTVSHKRLAQRTPKISAAIVQLHSPEFADSAISEKRVFGGRVHVSVL